MIMFKNPQIFYSALFTMNSSVSQLERFGQHYAGQNKKVGIRINPGVGSGGFSKSTTTFSKTNVGGPSSSFGIWKDLGE